MLLRTWAIWGKSKSILIFLSILLVVRDPEVHVALQVLTLRHRSVYWPR